jgi:signal transduction histidine kinase
MTGKTLVPQGDTEARELLSRLDSLVAFSRLLFGQVDEWHILQSACHAARNILLAQCAELLIRDAALGERRCRASGLTDAEMSTLLSEHLNHEVVTVLEAGGSVLIPMPEMAGMHTRAGPDSSSLLGVPIASGTRTYGYLCVVNRVGRSGFSEQDLAVANAIAAQVAVAYENARRHRALEAEVAQRAAAEEEIRRLAASLEQRVVERTAQLEVVNRELEAFTYSVAHDLRAPLRLIDAHCGMLREAAANAPPGSPLANHAAQIHQGAAQMRALIDGLLALSRVSHVDMKHERVPLTELARKAIERLESDTGGRAIQWQLADLPEVVCDPDLMQQVFANLLSNAIKYTRPRRAALVEIGIGAGDRGTHIYVRDNGVGFDMRYAAKLFGVFQRLHRQDQFEGTGIGLATVSRIIERHGGRIWGIWADSALDQGATFRFTLGGL